MKFDDFFNQVLNESSITAEPDELTNSQKLQLNDFWESTLLPTLRDEICRPDMNDVERTESQYGAVFAKRKKNLVNKALQYLNSMVQWYLR
jgi:hypothetical protein